ncbi:MAG: hypothetical protein ACR65T_13235 [Methylocystis sp.]|uniref:hypothetical protein n=1 Tax=Methylocystis sp. TaxID=1911079 RepID=UPI003DA1D1EE
MANNQMGLLAAMLGQQGSLDALGRGHDSAVKRFDTSYYDPYTQATSGAPGMQANALGLGGAAGNEAATNAFQAGPGYQFALGQGLEALNRNAASRGMLASGNNTQDILKYSQGLANQEYGNWQDRLGNFSGMGLNAAQGQTGRQGALANLDTGLGTQQANVFQNTTNSLMDLYKPQQQQQSGLGTALAGGLNLAGTLGLGGLALAPFTGGTSILPSSFAGQAIRNQLGHYFQR